MESRQPPLAQTPTQGLGQAPGQDFGPDLGQAPGLGRAQEKAALRLRLKAARASLPPEARRAASQRIMGHLLALPEVAAAGRLFIYLSAGPEVETHDLVRQLLAEGRLVLVPRITRARRMEAVPLTSFAGLAPGQLGILTPTEGEDHPGPVDVAVIPGLGFSWHGERLGFGAGYYDRWLAGHVVGLKVAVAFACQILPDLPTDATDVPMDALLTEAWTLRLFPGAAPPG
jgi:5-formyltetrahydrofolate cyclo-ligase